VPAGVVFDTQERSRDPHLKYSGMFVTVDHPQRGEVTMPGFAVHMSDSKVDVTPAPLLGADTRRVLADAMGMADEELDHLAETGVSA
jgi:crotonobetainyl-CoA:carnitine CoA-transferase CaiB-like acyl-CoA transferase